MKTSKTFRSGSCLYLVGMVFFTTAASLTDGAAQNILPGSIFTPEFEARREGTSGVIAIATDLLSPTQASATQASGDISITNRAKGLVQAGIDIEDPVFGTDIAGADVQLYAYTGTINDSLVFGRRLDVTTFGALGILEPVLTPLLQDVAGESVLNSWSSSITVGNLNIVQGQQYTVNFNAFTGGGLPVNLLTSASFSIANGVVPVNGTTLDLLGTLTVGPQPDTEAFSFTFEATENMSSLTFNFAAAATADVDILGGMEENQNVLTFSGLTLAPVPEPGSASLVLVAGLLLLFRRRSHLQMKSI